MIDGHVTTETTSKQAATYLQKGFSPATADTTVSVVDTNANPTKPRKSTNAVKVNESSQHTNVIQVQPDVSSTETQKEEEKVVLTNGKGSIAGPQSQTKQSFEMPGQTEDEVRGPPGKALVPTSRPSTSVSVSSRSSTASRKKRQAKRPKPVPVTEQHVSEIWVQS